MVRAMLTEKEDDTLVHMFDQTFNSNLATRTRPDFSLNLEPQPSTTATLLLGQLDSSVQVPRQFLCPITQEVMVEPVVAADGFSYEKQAISMWMARSNSGVCLSPMTRDPMEDGRLIPNQVVRSLIREFYEAHEEQLVYHVPSRFLVIDQQQQQEPAVSREL
eukprot:TRINITY_DN18695_c0_g1_i1.p1 TRINITY_DN18695_c0_g1~~TRINITY_DN18695_c0_g1_i1.p1  ORF type:complete len:162 (+),score=46.84 TRINITY_DN18695_c0_g1_i1:402-887(+)